MQRLVVKAVAAGWGLSTDAAFTRDLAWYTHAQPAGHMLSEACVNVDQHTPRLQQAIAHPPQRVPSASAPVCTHTALLATAPAAGSTKVWLSIATMCSGKCLTASCS